MSVDIMVWTMKITVTAADIMTWQVCRMLSCTAAGMTVYDRCVYRVLSWDAVNLCLRVMFWCHVVMLSRCCVPVLCPEAGSCRLFSDGMLEVTRPGRDCGDGISWLLSGCSLRARPRHHRCHTPTTSHWLQHTSTPPHLHQPRLISMS